MTAGTIRFVCTAPKKGTVKVPVDGAMAVADHGLDGDAHAGMGHRQVSLLAEADIATMRARGLELEPGAFGENLVVGGIDLDELGIGSVLKSDEVELEVTQIGKVCHDRCAIYAQTGDCIMPRAGLFAKVIVGGQLAPGQRLEVVAHVPRATIQAAVLTVSDSCAAGDAEDTAGPAVSGLLEERLGARLAWAGIEPDNADRLAERLQSLSERGLDLVLTAGGTGCGPRDVTPEATGRVIEREVPGLAEAMRAASARITPHALLQRGVAGIRHATLIVNLPGSRKAAIENLEVVLPALQHAVRLLRGDTAHPDDDRQRKQLNRPVRRGAFGG